MNSHYHISSSPAWKKNGGVLSSQSSILIIQFRALSFRGKYPHDYISPRGDGVVPDSPCRPGAASERRGDVDLHVSRLYTVLGRQAKRQAA